MPSMVWPPSVPRSLILGDNGLHCHGTEVHPDQMLRACQALLEALSRPLWVWKGTPGPLLRSHWDEERKPLVPQVDGNPRLSVHTSHGALCQCLLACPVPSKTACSWSAGSLLAQCPISSRVEQGGREAVTG